MRARLLTLCASIVALAACSETTLRRDSLSSVTIGGQEIVVSWVELPADTYDLVVGQVAQPGDAPLDRDTAIEAAGRVAAERCLLSRANAVFPPVEYAGGRFAFRYVCGRPAEPPPPPPGFEEEQ